VHVRVHFSRRPSGACLLGYLPIQAAIAAGVSRHPRPSPLQVRVWDVAVAVMVVVGGGGVCVYAVVVVCV